MELVTACKNTHLHSIVIIATLPVNPPIANYLHRLCRWSGKSGEPVDGLFNGVGEHPNG